VGNSSIVLEIDWLQNTTAPLPQAVSSFGTPTTPYVVGNNCKPPFLSQRSLKLPLEYDKDGFKRRLILEFGSVEPVLVKGIRIRLADISVQLKGSCRQVSAGRSNSAECKPLR
jgi:hypothetical protein